MIELCAVINKTTQATRYYANNGEGFKRVTLEGKRAAMLIYPRHSCFVTKDSKTHTRHYLTIQAAL